MDLRGFAVVVAVAEQGSVTHAAAALHQSSSAVSHTLLALEAELGIDLFHRLPRGMTTTDAGVVFVEAARRALHEAEAARRSVDAVRGVVTGQVTVVPVLGFAVALADLIGAFARLHPDVVVRVLSPAPTDAVVDLVRNGRSDLGFTWGVEVPDDLDAAPVLGDPSVVLVPDGHRLSTRTTVTIGDLRGERLVAPLGTSTMRPAFDHLVQRHGVDAEVVAEAATAEMVAELVRAGVGCTVTFASSAPPVVGRGAVALAIDDAPEQMFLVVRRSRQQPTPAARALVDLATSHFSSPR